MSTITVESTSTAYVNGTTLIINKPSGLAVGDLMVFAGVNVVASVAGSVGITTLSGWTLAESLGTAGSHSNIQYKIADSSDVAASDFSWTYTGSDAAAGTIFRLTNHDATNTIEANDSDETGAAAVDTTVALSPSLAVTVDNCLLIAALSVTDATAANPAEVGSYTSTPSLTWTETMDIHGSGNDGGALIGGSVAYAVNTGTTTLSAFGATLDQGMDDQTVSIVAIRPNYPTSGTAVVHITSPTFFSPTAESGTSGTATLHTASPTFPTTSGQGIAPQVWTTENKS